jgi:hypothetical protein
MSTLATVESDVLHVIWLDILPSEWLADAENVSD